MTEPEDERPSRARIELDMNVMFCPEHLKPFEKYWPKGYPEAMTLLFQEAVGRKEVVEAADHNADLIGFGLASVAPVCCFVGSKAMKRIYKKVGVK